MKKIFDLTLTVLSPLHIGSGRELLHEYDYMSHRGQTWVLDTNAILDDLQRPDGSFDERLLQLPPGQLLADADFQPKSPRFRYIMKGTPRSHESGAVLREQYKDVFGRPYIPGSSLKGALRTLIAWYGFQEKHLKLDINELGNNPSWAAQVYEKSIFGATPNVDLLRAVQVADSDPVESNLLEVINAQVVTAGTAPGAPVEMEAVQRAAVFHTTVTLDTYLHSPAVEASLQYGERWDWLEIIPRIAQAWAASYLPGETAWYKNHGYLLTSRFYEEMLQMVRNRGLGRHRFFLHLGWGGGWNITTIGSPLRSDPAAWAELIKNKRLSPAHIGDASPEQFPESRRVIMDVIQDRTGQRKIVPNEPPGWCLVEMRERTT